MADMTRRRVFKVSSGTIAAAAAAGLMEADHVEAKDAQDGGHPGAHAVKATSSFKFRLADAPMEKYSGGVKRQAVVETFPASPDMSGAMVTLEPGGMREPHWHPNCTEWDFVASGSIRFSIVGPTNEAETFDITVGDVVVIPQGYAHYFENVTSEPATLFLSFNTGHFHEIGVTDWVAKTPKGVFEVPLNLSKDALNAAPDHRVFITNRKTPGK